MLLLCCLVASTGRGTFAAEPPAKMTVSGYGLIGNRLLKSLLDVLEAPGKKRPYFQANDIEDAVLILFSRIQRDGYLHPVIHATVRTAEGEESTFTWAQPLGEPLPRPLAAKSVHFTIDPGVLFYFDKIYFEGGPALSTRDAAHFFVETDAIIFRKRNRVYSPEKLRAGVKNLEEGYNRLGYESASVIATNLVVNTNTGAVRVDIKIEQGPQSIVRSIRKEILPSDSGGETNVQTIQTNVIYSRMWQEDLSQALKREQYRDGHALARVEITQTARNLHAGTNWIELRARIFPGAQIHVGQVVFTGEEKTRESMMRRRVRIHAGDLLNPIEAEQGRYRLARLGIFDEVTLRYDHVDEDTRDVEYQVKEGKTIDFSLLAGYGSYEKLRGGVEVEQYNLWGLGHYQRLKAIQSFKSSSADYTYTMPELLGEDLDAFVNGQGLIRDEIDFTRKEFGAAAGVNRRFRQISTDLSARYSYQILTATREDFDPAFGLQRADVGSFIFDLRHDRQDNPLMPRKGYKVFSNLEVASPLLLGDAEFQRMDTSFAYHLPVGPIQWLHFGLAHGFITTGGDASRDLPFNKRFFPGGDNSIRGYQFGQAAPRDSHGNLAGAETYLLGNFEFEQGLTKSWSVVFFFDALGEATRIEQYPMDEELYSAGIGLRWKTIIGPVRLEYGHNLNPREEDPSGTLHLAIGFPF